MREEHKALVALYQRLVDAGQRRCITSGHRTAERSEHVRLSDEAWEVSPGEKASFETHHGQGPSDDSSEPIACDACQRMQRPKTTIAQRLASLIGRCWTTSAY